jgi:pimeloyl-ACP methyl ester carboxylesterase
MSLRRFSGLTFVSQVLIGHDWGSFIVGRFALWHPDRLVALIMCVILRYSCKYTVIEVARMSIPYTPPARVYMPLEKIVEQIPNFGYQLYFASKESTSEIETQVRS